MRAAIGSQCKIITEIYITIIILLITIQNLKVIITMLLLRDYHTSVFLSDQKKMQCFVVNLLYSHLIAF